VAVVYLCNLVTISELFNSDFTESGCKTCNMKDVFLAVLFQHILLLVKAHSLSGIVFSMGAFHWDIQRPACDQISTGAQWNAFGRLVGHPPAAEKRRD